MRLYYCGLRILDCGFDDFYHCKTIRNLQSLSADRQAKSEIIIIGNMAVKRYKDLIIWQRSMDIVELIYQITEEFPSGENFGIISQMRRAAVSIPSNIAEGYGRQSTGSYAQFLSIARGSLFELETQIEICIRLKYIQKIDSEKICNEITEISKMLTSLISKIK